MIGAKLIIIRKNMNKKLRAMQDKQTKSSQIRKAVWYILGLLICMSLSGEIKK